MFLNILSIIIGLNVVFVEALFLARYLDKKKKENSKPSNYFKQVKKNK